MPSTEPTPRISLSEVVVYTHHGVSDAEQKVGQRMVFDLELVPVECRAIDTDDVNDTVNYGEVTRWLVERATATSYRTLERLVTVLADELMARFPVSYLWIRATKPVPPIPVTMGGASVEITRSRDE